MFSIPARCGIIAALLYATFMDTGVHEQFSRGVWHYSGHAPWCVLLWQAQSAMRRFLLVKLIVKFSRVLKGQLSHL